MKRAFALGGGARGGGDKAERLTVSRKLPLFLGDCDALKIFRSLGLEHKINQWSTLRSLSAQVVRDSKEKAVTCYNLVTRNRWHSPKATRTFAFGGAW